MILTLGYNFPNTFRDFHSCMFLVIKISFIFHNQNPVLEQCIFGGCVLQKFDTTIIHE